MPQLRVPAVYMRGGSGKGVFFHVRDLLPAGPARDALLLWVIGSPLPTASRSTAWAAPPPAPAR